MRRLIGWAGLVVVVALLHGQAKHILAADKPAPEILPESTAVYLEAGDPKQVIGLLLDSPLWQRIEQSPQYRKATEDPKFAQLQMVVRLIEQRAGVNWRAALDNAVDGGVVIAFDPQSKGVVLLAHSRDSKTTDSVRDALFTLIRDDASNKGNANPIESVDYRSIKAWKINDAVIGQVGSWLLLSNKLELARNIVDRFLDGGASLAADPKFKEARSTSKQDSAGAPSAWVFAQLDSLRAIMGDKAFLDPKYKSENPAAEFLLGGFVPLLQKSPYATASLTLHADEIKLALTAAYDPQWIPAEKKFFFASEGDGAPKPLRPGGTILSAAVYRDLSSMWQSAPDLFSDAVAAQMAETDSKLSTFFGGKSFSADVLGAIKPQMQLVLARQDYKAANLAEPSLKLPGGALVMRIKPQQFDSVRKHFRVGFQTVIAFANLDGSAKGRPLLEVQTEKRGSAEIMFAAYDSGDKPAAAPATAPAAREDAYLNFSPALVMSKNYMILCSTRQLGEELADLIDKEGDAHPVIDRNLQIELDAVGIAALLKDDREQLIAQNMLEKGHDRPAAEKEIDLLLSIVNSFKSGRIEITPSAHSIKLEVNVKLSEGLASGAGH